MRSIIALYIIVLSLPSHVFGRQHDKDSLSSLIEKSKNDSIKIEAYIRLAHQADSQLEAIEYSLQAIEIAENANYPKLKGDLYNMTGIFYYQLSDYEKTLDYFYQALEVHEALNDRDALSKSYNNIGLILSDLGRLEETVEYHKRSLALKQELNEQDGIANSLSNLGLAYEALDSLDLAMQHYRQALVIDQKLNNHYGLYTTYNNIGQNHFKRGQYDSTAYYYNKAIMLSDKIDSQFNKAQMLRDYGHLNKATGEYSRAIEKYNSSIMLAESVNAKSIIRDNFLGLSEVYEYLGDVDRAFDCYQKYDSINDLIFNEEQTETLAEIEGNYQIQKSQKEIELLRKESEIKDLRIRNNTYLLYFLISLIVLTAVIVILLYRKNLYKTRTNLLLKTQNDEIIEKNKDIMDSIVYAKSIQKAILPSGKKLKEIFKDAFVYSKARDVVNGDFYWFAEKNDKIVIAAVDCTGHGVPAAFLNVLGNSHLNTIVYEQNILQPAEILKQLNERVLDSLHGNKMGLHADEGMDVGLCLIDKKTLQVSFGGAKRHLYYFQNDELKIIKGDGQPVGGESYQARRAYNQHELQLSKNDCIYLFTDGIIDQFGGKKNKKFMYPRLRKLLKRVHDKPMEDQLTSIKENLTDWQGTNQQTDDVLIIGIRL